MAHALVFRVWRLGLGFRCLGIGDWVRERTVRNLGPVLMAFLKEERNAIEVLLNTIEVFLNEVHLIERLGQLVKRKVRHLR